MLLAGLAGAAPQELPDYSTFLEEDGSGEPFAPPHPKVETDVSSEEASAPSAEAIDDEAMGVAAAIVKARLNRTEQLTESVPEAPEEGEGARREWVLERTRNTGACLQALLRASTLSQTARQFTSSYL